MWTNSWSKTLDKDLEPLSHGTTYTNHLEPHAKSINQGLDGIYVPTPPIKTKWL